MALVSPHKPFPVTKPRAWTMQETRIPPRPSPSTASRNESRRVMVLNPAFQMLNQPQYSGNEAEEDMQPTLMEAPRRQVPPRRVTKTEKLNVLRECRWDVSGDVDAKDESVSGRVSLSRPLIVLLGAVCLTSLLSMLLTLLILFGTVGARKCSCNANEGPAPDVQEDKGIPVDELLKNMTSLEKRLVARIEKLEKLGSEEKDKLVDNEFATVWLNLNKSKESCKNVNSTLQTFKTEVEINLRNVWSSVNKTSECCSNMMTSLQSLTSEVTIDFQTLRARVKIEEDKSNKSSETAVQHSKDIAALETSLNSTRQEVKVLSLVWISVNSTEQELQQQTHALWTARNFTQKEVGKLWSAVNSTSTKLQQELGQVQANLSAQVNNVTKMSGPAGLQGYNGSQGPAGAQGPAGPAGPQGAQGAGDFTQCKYKLLDSGGSTSGPTYSSDTSIPEPTGKKIVGATCSTNHAAEYIFSASLVGVVQYYTCQCRGEAAKFPSYGVQTHCYLHYWECPSTT